MNYFWVLVGVAAEQILLDSEHDRGDDACYRRCVGMHGLAAGAGPTRMLSAATASCCCGAGLAALCAMGSACRTSNSFSMVVDFILQERARVVTPVIGISLKGGLRRLVERKPHVGRQFVTTGTVCV
jgi:hypothetical protein